MNKHYTLAGEVSVEDFVAMAEEAADKHETLILPFIESDPQDELAARRHKRSGDVQPSEFRQFINVSVEQYDPFVVHADMINGDELPFVHIQANGGVVSFDVIDFQ